MFARSSSLDRAVLARLGGCAAAGALGLLGARDPVALLGWLTLLAPAAGALCGACVPFWLALAAPATWTLFLVLAQAQAARGLATPLWAACAVGGLFALGFALGARVRVPARAAGLLLLFGLALAGAPVGFGLVAGGAELARARPAAAARLLDLSPLVLTFDCAGLDWTHAQPEVYSAAGLEWFQRRAYPGNLAGPAVLVVGCLLAWLATRRVPAAPAR